MAQLNEMAYFGILINSVLPIIFISFIGFVLGKKGIFSLEEARIINKFVAMIGVPAISIAILQKGSLDNLNLELCLLYITAEMIVYISAFLITKYCFGRDNIESILIAIASSFSNHVLFIYPIVKLIFPAEELIQVYGIIIFDVIILATSVFLIDVFSNQGKDIKSLFFKTLVNPVVIGLLVGIILANFPTELPKGVFNSVEFIADSAAPCALFILGILLSLNHAQKDDLLSYLIISFKLFLHPLLALVLILYVFHYEWAESKTTILVTVAPVGVMAMTFATRYGVPTQAISKSMFWSLLLSLALIPLVGAI